MNADRIQLKRATELLVKSVGGIEAAASLLGRGTSTVGRWVNRNDSEHFINLADLRELEANAEAPLATAALSRLAGGVFIPLPQAPGASDALPMQVMQLAKELGDLSGSISEGLCDNDFSPSDAQRALDELHDVERCVAALKLALVTARDAAKPSELKAVA